MEGCEIDDISISNFEINFSGKVIIVGAGAAGLTAAYILQKNNIDFQIIEAAPNYGGRLKRTDAFVDFPIDLGAEWIHASPSVLAEILDNPDLDATVDFITYNPQTFRIWKDGELKKANYASNFYSEYKFKNTTWFGFFERFMVPEFVDKMILGKPISSIQYSGDKVRLHSTDSESFEADRVIVTVPIKILQNEDIEFIPALPDAKREAINSISMGDGLKAFIEFKERFYPDILLFGNIVNALASDDKIFYDAAFRKDTDKNVLGLFTINEMASDYTNLGSDQAIIEKILNELDEIFDGKASENYVHHVIQNWSKEPFIQGSYSYNFDMNQQDTVNTITEPINNKIYFAGEALSVDYQATVHGACDAAYEAVERLLKD